MAISDKNINKNVAIVRRISLVFGMVAVIAVIAESQSPEGGFVGSQQASEQKTPAKLSGMPKLAEFPNVGASGDMIGFSHSDDSGTQTITLVHTEKSWMAVYHIDRSGTLRLVSSRPIEADFSLQLNATSPLPEEIRQIGGR